MWLEPIFFSCFVLVYWAIVFVVELLLPVGLEEGIWWWAAVACGCVLYYRIKLPHWKWYTHWALWVWMRDVWFPLTYVNLPPLTFPDGEVDQPIYVYLMTPHGVASCASIYGILMNPFKFENIHCLCASHLFWIPIVRNIAQLCGVGPATKSNIVKQLDNGMSILLVPEGMRAFVHLSERQDGMMKVLRKHKGFSRLLCASKNAARVQIVPVHTPGEWDMFYTLLPWPRLQSKMISWFWYAGPFLTLGWWGSFAPKRAPLTMHFGEPLSLVSADGALKTADQVHDEFCAAIETLSKQCEAEKGKQ